MVDSHSVFTKVMLAVSTGINKERQNKQAGALASQISAGSLSVTPDRIPSIGQNAGDDVNRNLRKYAVSGRCWARIIGMLEWWEDIEEPPRSGRLYIMVHSDTFEYLSSAVILANCAFSGYVADWQIRHIGERSAVPIQVVELLFVLYYCAEVVLRLAVHGRYFFVNGDARWNSFDFCLLLLTLDELVLSRLAMIHSHAVNIVFLRILRLARMARILRTLRVIKVFKELAIILDSFRTCFVSLFWCLLTMSFIFYVFALILLQGMTAHLEDAGDQITDEELASVRTYFGTLGTTILSLYMAVTGGDDWGNTFKVIRLGGEPYAALFLFFTFFFMFAVLNILTGVFVDKAMAAAAPSAEARILESQQQSMFEATTLRHLCQEMDADGDGYITPDELQHHMTNDYFLAYLSSIGLHIRDSRLFFDLLLPTRRKETDRIHIDALVDGFLAWKGTASTLDMQRQLRQTEAVQKQLADVEFKIFEAVQALEARLVQNESKFPSHEDSEYAKKQCDSQASSSSQHDTKRPATIQMEPGERLDRKMPQSLQPKLGMMLPDDDATSLEKLEKDKAIQQNFQPFLDRLRDEMLSDLVQEVAGSICYLLEAQLSSTLHHPESLQRTQDSPGARSSHESKTRATPPQKERTTQDSPGARSSHESKTRATPPHTERTVLTSPRRRPPPQHGLPKTDEALHDAYTKQVRQSWPLPGSSQERPLVDMLRRGKPANSP